MTTIRIQGHDFDVDLPELTGTPKQVAWATDIRRQAITLYVEGRVKTDTPERIAAAGQGLIKMAADLGKITTARAWIDASATVEHHITYGRAPALIKALLAK